MTIDTERGAAAQALPAQTNEPVTRAQRLAGGQTWRYRRDRNRWAEAAARATVADAGVIRAGSRTARAAALEAIACDPRAQAYANRTIRAAVMGMAGVGIALGVLISSSAAQHTIATFMRWQPGGVAYYAAYGADPALGLVLFATLLLRSVATARGVGLTTATRRVFDRVEVALFVLVATLNAGPAVFALGAAVLSGRWDAVGPAAMVLVIHTLGPVLVATGVFAVPHMGVVLAEISAATTARLAATHTTPPVLDPATDTAAGPATGTALPAPATVPAAAGQQPPAAHATGTVTGTVVAAQTARAADTPDAPPHAPKPSRAVKRQPSAADRVARAVAKTPEASAAQIAARLGLSERTVQRHLSRLAVDSVSTASPPVQPAA